MIIIICNVQLTVSTQKSPTFLRQPSAERAGVTFGVWSPQFGSRDGGFGSQMGLVSRPGLGALTPYFGHSPRALFHHTTSVPSVSPRCLSAPPAPSARANTASSSATLHSARGALPRVRGAPKEYRVMRSSLVVLQ